MPSGESVFGNPRFCYTCNAL